MSEILKTFSFTRKSCGSGKYPWNEWLDGKIRRLVRGKDFTIDPEHFRISCHGAARSRKLVLQTRREGRKSLVIQATARNGVNGKARKP